MVKYISCINDFICSYFLKGGYEMNIYLVRHGRQLSPRCNVNVDLSNEGILQSKLLAERLKEVPFDALYSSNLIRAIHTAELINREHGLKHEIREGIKEIDYGDWTGLEDDEIKEKYKDFILENDRLRDDLRFPGGECGQDVVQRAMPIINELIASGKQNILVVTHGGVIRALTSHLLGLDQSQKALFGVALEHTGITEFVYNEEKNRFYLQRFNDYAHLEGYDELMRHSWKK